MPMLTMKQTQTEAKKRQRAYIRDERRKMRRLRTARIKYENVARELNFHPLESGEIYRRLKQLDEMETDLLSGAWLQRQIWGN
jgi:hypothetical protein